MPVIDLFFAHWVTWVEAEKNVQPKPHLSCLDDVADVGTEHGQLKQASSQVGLFGNLMKQRKRPVFVDDVDFPIQDVHLHCRSNMAIFHMPNCKSSFSWENHL